MMKQGFSQAFEYAVRCESVYFVPRTGIEENGTLFCEVACGKLLLRKMFSRIQLESWIDVDGMARMVGKKMCDEMRRHLTDTVKKEEE